MEDGCFCFCMLCACVVCVVAICNSIKSYNIIDVIPFYGVSETDEPIEGYTVIMGEPESKNIRRLISTEEKTWEIQKDGTWEECYFREHDKIREKLKAWLEMNAVKQVVNQEAEDNNEE